MFHESYSNPNVKWILIAGIFSSITGSILWFSTTWLIYGLGGSNEDLGRILGTAGLLGVAVTLVASKIGDSYRKDIVIWFAGGFLILGSFILAYSSTLTHVFIGQMVVVIGGSATFPVLAALFADSIPGEHRNRIFGTQFLLQNLFNAVGNLFGYFIFRDLSTTNIADLDTDLIRFTIFVAAISEIIAFALILRIRDRHSLSAEEEGTIASQPAVVEEERVAGDQTKSSWFNPRDFAPGSLSILFLTLMAAFLIGFGAGITIPFLPRFFFDVYEVDLADLSLIFALLTIITAIWGKINANLADKYGRVELIVINQMVSVTLLIVLSFYPPLAFAFLVLIIRNAVMNGVGPVNAAIQMEYTPRKYRSQINALNTLAWAFLFSI